MRSKFFKQFIRLSRAAREAVVTMAVVAGVVAVILASDALEPLHGWMHRNGARHVADLLVTFLFVSCAAVVFSLRRWNELRVSTKRRLQIEAALRVADRRAIEHYEQLHEQLTTLAQAVGSAQELTTVFRALDRFVMDSTPSQSLFVSLYDAVQAVRTCVFASSEGREVDVSALPPMGISNSPHSRSIETGQILVTDDLQTALVGQPRVDIGFDIDPRAPRSGVAVPLQVMGRTVGGFEAQSTMLAAYQAEHVTALRMAANIAAIAIENVRLLERERALRITAEASEHRFRSLVLHAPDVICLLDIHGTVLYQTPSVERILGFSPEELVGTNIFNRLDPDDLFRIQREFSDLTQTAGGLAATTFRLRHSDGTWHDIEATGQNLLEEPSVAAIVINYRDITRQHQVEEALRYRIAVEQLIATISTHFVNLPAHALEHTIDETLQTIGSFADVDRSYLMLFSDDGGTISTTYEWYADGSAPQNEQFLGLPVSRLPWWMEQLARNEPLYIAGLADLPPEASAERELLQARNTQSLIVVPMMYEGIIGGFLGFDLVSMRKGWRAEDILLLKMLGTLFSNALMRLRAEDALRASEERFRNSYAAVGQTTMDLQGRFMTANRAFCELTGYEEAELVGMTLEQLTHPDDLPRCLELNQRLSASVISHFNVEKRYVRKDGELVTVLLSAALLRNASGTPKQLMGLMQDITERKRAEQALIEAVAMAEAANRAKSEFLSRMSHELRTPLNAILGFAQLLQRTSQSALDQESVEHILKGGRHLLGLINEVLDISRIETGNLALALEPVPLSDVVAESLDMLASQASSSAVSLHNHLDPDTSYPVLADRQRLKQVLINLLSNAIKYNHPGGDVWVSTETPVAGSLRLLIRDSGIGIDPHDFPRLFEPFNRIGAERSGVEGTGLGLALTKGLADMMGHRLGVESTLEQGSTFWLDLPLLESTTMPLAKAPDLSPELIARPATVLCIDDTLSNLQLVERILAQRPNTTVLTAMRGARGVQLARTQHPDIILLDLHLPDLPGVEVLRQLKADPTTQDIPVLMLSADAMQMQIERLLLAGASAYLTKPLDIEEFLSVLETTLIQGTQ